MPAETTADDPTEAVRAAWRADSARLVGALTRMTRDVELAADLAQDALVAALEQWSVTGIPDNPTAWSMTTAKRRGVDHFRRADNLRRKVAELEGAHRGEEAQVPDLDNQVDQIEDDVLRLVFLSCHPLLTAQTRAALTLRLVGGLTTAEIARGFLTTEATMAQRISRAKRTLSLARADFELPTGERRGWRGCSLRSRPTSPRSSGCRRCWRSRAHGQQPDSTRTAPPFCWRRRTVSVGTS